MPRLMLSVVLSPSGQGRKCKFEAFSSPPLQRFHYVLIAVFRTQNKMFHYVLIAVCRTKNKSVATHFCDRSAGPARDPAGRGRSVARPEVAGGWLPLGQHRAWPT